METWLQSSRITAVRVKILVMHPAAGAIKTPGPELWTAYEDRDWCRPALIDFDSVSGSCLAQDCFPLGSRRTFPAFKPLLVAAAQNDRKTHGRMIVQGPRVVGFQKTMEINIEGGIVAPQLPAFQIRLPLRSFDNSGRWMALNIAQDAGSQKSQHAFGKFHSAANRYFQ